VRRARGFSLIEVLVALAVVAIALVALVRAATSQVSDFDGLRERTLAGWVAANVLTETRLTTALPPLGRREGRTTFARRDWRWTLEVQATADPDLRRLDVAVYASEGAQPVVTLAGFGSNQPVP